MYSLPELLVDTDRGAYQPQSRTVSKKSELAFIPALGHYDRAHYWKLDAKSITAMSCVNTSLSSFLFCATSDR
jgi:hypothetical protein